MSVTNNSLNLNATTPMSPAIGGTGVSNGTHTLTINANSIINQNVSTTGTPSFTSASFGNLNLASNVLTSTNTNGYVSIKPNGTGRILLGDTNTSLPTGGANSVQIYKSGVIADLTLNTYDNSSFGNVLSFYKSRSAVPGTQTSVANGDNIVVLAAQADTGSSNQTSSTIVMSVGGVPGSSYIPGKIAFSTTSASGSPTVLAMTINDAQQVILTNALGVTSGGTGLNSTSINQLLYSSAANTMSGLASANNGLLTTNSSGVPAINNTIGADITVHTLTVGQGNYADVLNTNTVVGYLGLASNTSGTFNSGFGFGALQSVVAGSRNTGFGANSAISNDGDDNLFLGSGCANSLGSVANGNKNVIVGNEACNGGGNPAGNDLLAGDSNTILGYFASVSNPSTSGCIGIGAYSNVDAATGTLSTQWGPGIAVGAASHHVGFRGDGTALPGGSANYWRVKINDTYFNIPILPDGTGILWPASGTLATTGTTQSWQNVTTATVTIVPGTWYVANYTGGTTVFSLPATAPFGSEFRIKGGLSGSGWKITQAAGQQINIGIDSSTVGATGYVQSNRNTDYLALTCLTANTSFSDSGFTGNISLV